VFHTAEAVVHIAEAVAPIVPEAHHSPADHIGADRSTRQEEENHSQVQEKAAHKWAQEHPSLVEGEKAGHTGSQHVDKDWPWAV